jgi:hypothetical protein
MSEELKPLLGSMVFPVAETVAEPVREVPVVSVAVEVKKVDKSLPKLKTEGNQIISMSALKVNASAGNSNSVQVVQLRLKELGFDSVVEDKFGRLGEGSVEAINDYRKSVGLEACGYFDSEVLAYLFDGQDVGVRE